MSDLKSHLSACSSILLALLPQAFCPSCWPAYAGVLSSLGLGFIDYTPYLLPLMVIFLGIALWSMSYRAARRRGYGPLVLGCLATVAIILGKFVLGLDGLLYSGVVLFAVASAWNAWPKRTAACPAC